MGWVARSEHFYSLCLLDGVMNLWDDHHFCHISTRIFSISFVTSSRFSSSPDPEKQPTVGLNHVLAYAVRCRKLQLHLDLRRTTLLLTLREFFIHDRQWAEAFDVILQLIIESY